MHSLNLLISCTVTIISSVLISCENQTKENANKRVQYRVRRFVNEHNSLSVAKLQQSQNISPWSNFTCCRPIVRIQTRKRLLDNRYLQMEAQNCNSNYCTDCYERLDICEGLRDYQHGCTSIRLKGFMSRHCPATCGWCEKEYLLPKQIPSGAKNDDIADQSANQSSKNAQSEPPASNPKQSHFERTGPIIFTSTSVEQKFSTTFKPDTTIEPMSVSEASTSTQPVFVRFHTIHVYFSGLSTGKYTYKFTTSSEGPRWPWNPISMSKNLGEIGSFKLYESPTGSYTKAIHFCKARLKGSRRNWIVSSHPCTKDWETDVTLYGSQTYQANSELISVANRGWFPWNSRVYRGKPCCDYVYRLWSFYAPLQVTTSARTTFTSAISTTETTAFATTSTGSSNFENDEMIVKKKAASTLKFSDENGDLSSVERACLYYHNYFRFAHGVPILQLDDDLIKTAQKWANFLANNAPKHPFITKPGMIRTKNWPHSKEGTEYRQKDVGENIAWDFSVNPSPANLSVLRWYVEVFDYNQSNPAFKNANHPTSQFTQLLWKASTRLGCATAARTVRRGPFEYTSTYTVAHYSPAGNTEYELASKTKTTFDRNVPVRKPGTCVSPRNCSVHSGMSNHCMGFSSNMNCGCATDNASVFGGRPKCTGEGGCIVTCKKPSASDHRKFYAWTNECLGQRSCECVYSPSKEIAGAVCS